MVTVSVPFEGVCTGRGTGSDVGKPSSAMGLLDGLLDLPNKLESMVCCTYNRNGTTAKTGADDSMETRAAPLMEDRTRGWTPVKEGPGMSQSTLSSVAFQSPAAHSAAESEVPQRRAVVPASASPTRLQAPLPPPSGGSPEKKTGVGIVFKERQSTGALVISSIAVGGPAHADGSIQAGDSLLQIDGTDVSSLGVRQLGPLILGAPGSHVRLALRSGATGQVYERVLERQWALSQAGPLGSTRMTNHVNGRLQCGVQVLEQGAR